MNFSQQITECIFVYFGNLFMAFKIVTFFYEFILITRNDPFIVVELPKKNWLKGVGNFHFNAIYFYGPQNDLLKRSYLNDDKWHYIGKRINGT